jgi:hypothetical protein
MLVPRIIEVPDKVISKNRDMEILAENCRSDSDSEKKIIKKIKINKNCIAGVLNNSLSDPYLNV